MEISDIKQISKKNSQINKDFSVGYRSVFNDQNIIIGRSRNLIIGGQLKQEFYFAIVDLDDIVASHNYKNFSSSHEYPTLDGENVNDRNYSEDKNAQANVYNIAQNLIPDILISTSATSSGTPIITVDGIVISGNNRVMSLKLAEEQYTENYQKYLKVLGSELSAGGYGQYITKAGPEILQHMSFIHPSSSFHEPKRYNIKKPVLVRLLSYFEGYSKENLNKFNVVRGKQEKPIDQVIRISSLLKANLKCKEELLNIIGMYDVLSDLYASKDSLKAIKNKLIACNILTQQKAPLYFTENNMLTDEGKVFIGRILLSTVFDPKTVNIIDSPGVKSYKNKIMNSIVELSKIQSLSSYLIEIINGSINLQFQVVNSGLDYKNYITTTKIYDDYNFSFEDKVINYFINENKQLKIKELLKKYFSSLSQNQGESMFENEKLSEKQIFNLIFVKDIPEQQLSIIEKTNVSDKKTKEIINQIPEEKKELDIDFNKIDENIKKLESIVNFLSKDKKEKMQKNIEELKKLKSNK